MPLTNSYEMNSRTTLVSILPEDKTGWCLIAFIPKNTNWARQKVDVPTTEKSSNIAVVKLNTHPYLSPYLKIIQWISFPIFFNLNERSKSMNMHVWGTAVHTGNYRTNLIAWSCHHLALTASHPTITQLSFLKCPVPKHENNLIPFSSPGR